LQDSHWRKQLEAVPEVRGNALIQRADMLGEDLT
jgi:hypothetical protein